MVFPLYDVRYIATNDNVDTARDDNEMMAFRNLCNDRYAHECSKKTKAVINYKGKAGMHLANTPPYGYIKNPEDTEEWILDEAAATIVAEIFRLFLSGTGIANIARILCERKVLTPQAHKQHYGIVKATSPVPKQKQFFGNVDTVGAIIDNEAYMGITVNFKSHSISFKNKKRIKNDKSAQKVFEDTHHAIVDKETWRLAQGLRRTRHRPTDMGELNMLSGYLYCADCGARMTLMRTIGKKYEYYYCGKYRAKSNSSECTSHLVRADVVETLLLENIRAIAAFVNEYEDEFVTMVRATPQTPNRTSKSRL
ncbi:MAG: recombinase family protein [Oscillospiraceae bacterium]|nr:recombinase family protein [Oscillospiraceae bacterium]